MLKGARISDGITLLVEDMDGAEVIFPKNGGEEAKKKVLNLLSGNKSNLTEKELKELESHLKFVAQEDFAKENGIEFVESKRKLQILLIIKTN